jgi:hypothetical protein
LLGIGGYIRPPQLPRDEKQENDTGGYEQLTDDLHGLPQNYDAGHRRGRGSHLLLQYHGVSFKAVAGR